MVNIDKLRALYEEEFGKIESHYSVAEQGYIWEASSVTFIVRNWGEIIRKGPILLNAKQLANILSKQVYSLRTTWIEDTTIDGEPASVFECFIDAEKKYYRKYYITKDGGMHGEYRSS